MEVNPDLMASARSAVQRLDALARRSSTSAAAGDDLDETAIKAFNSAMDDDLGTPQGVAVMFDTLHRANAALDRGAEEALSLTATAISLAGALGLSVDEGDGGTDADSAVEELVARRQAAREAKDWAAADALRDELAALGVVVEDTPAGPIWRRQ
ncbi:MAG: hypothetical protein F4Z26_06775 [Acidimicrobiaceae bacterium]|nr:hypothetical protein [Acidimicrobiaceae bacterium]